MTPRARSAAAVVLSAALVDCSSEEPAPSTVFPTRDRYVSMYLPAGGWDRRWIPESRLSPEPQKSPWMVIYEVTRYPGAEPTPAQRSAADELAERSLESARRHAWFEFLSGLADGYRLAVGDDTHYANEEYILDDRILDPDRPEFLMYYETEQGKKLTGFMYYARKLREEGPQIGGPLTIWHYHVWTRAHCLRQGLVATGVVDARGRCAAGRATHRSPEMLHVWFVDHPDGPFGTPMRLPTEVIDGLSWD